MGLRINMADFAKLPAALQERIAAAARAAKAATGAEIVKKRRELVEIQTEAKLFAHEHKETARERAGKKRKRLTPASEALAKAQRDAQREKLELRMITLLQVAGLWPFFVRDYEFHPTRKWRLDFYASRWKLALEVHGGVDLYGGAGGRHTRGKGFTEDRVKMNTAAIGGITTLEFTAEHLKDGTAIEQIKLFIAERGGIDVQHEGDRS